MTEEVRHLQRGPLAGAIVIAEAREAAPFGYWLTVHRLAPNAKACRPVLRYRSATHYSDGNRLAVIETEVPNLLARLQLWHPGEPRPRLIHMEL